MSREVIVIGGGASGLTAAIWAARSGARAVILEHGSRVGKKILSTGNGRCNMTNLVQHEECYRGDQPGFGMRVVNGFGVEKTLDFFEELGILPEIKDGYVYPRSGQASSVLDVLRLEASRLGVGIICECEPEEVTPPGGRRGAFRVAASTGTYEADAVILATGSRAAPKTGSDGSGYRLAARLGHRVIDPLPALVQLRCEGQEKQLAGIRTQARVTLAVKGRAVAQDQGELQLTDYGISGIPVFQVSRYAAKALSRKEEVRAVADFLPMWTVEEARARLSARRECLGYRDAEYLLTGLLNKKLTDALLKQAGIRLSEKAGRIGKDRWEALVALLKGRDFPVKAANSFDQAQVCCGGVDTREVDPATMESRVVKGLYLAGEILDVDGICGGYNLQFAWSGGAVAGRCAGKEQDSHDQDQPAEAAGKAYRRGIEGRGG